MAKLNKGDQVRWNTSQGQSTGRIERVVKSKTNVGGTELKGFPEDPVHIAKSEKTGKTAGHNAEALSKARLGFGPFGYGQPT
jgi:hypothetical protein